MTQPSAAPSNTFTLLQINDMHGYLEPHPELVWSTAGPEFPIPSGFAWIKALFDATRAEAPGAVLTFDNGDTFHGTYAAVSNKGEGLVPLVSAMGLGR